MDIHVLDTINKANNNIETLIEEIIELKQLNSGRNCCYGALENRPKCSGECGDCKEKYYNKMYEDMVNEFIVSL